MFRYASTVRFSGQPASLGRSVLVCTDSGRLVPASIEEIEETDGFVMVRVFHRGLTTPRCYAFQEIATADGVHELAPGSWTWPPRV